MNLQAWATQLLLDSGSPRGVAVPRQAVPPEVVSEVDRRGDADAHPLIAEWAWLAVGYAGDKGWSHPECLFSYLYSPVAWGFGYGDAIPLTAPVVPIGRLYTREVQERLRAAGALEPPPAGS